MECIGQPKANNQRLDAAEAPAQHRMVCARCLPAAVPSLAPLQERLGIVGEARRGRREQKGLVRRRPDARGLQRGDVRVCRPPNNV